MKRKQVRALLPAGRKKKRVIRKVFIISFILICAIILLVIYANKNKKHYVNYSEESKTRHKVYLQENEFFEDDYLDEKNQYVSALIDYIEANFNYDLNLTEDNIEYDYTYRVEAKVNIKEKNGTNSIYNFTDEILEKNTVKTNNQNTKINETIKIDYNHYNDIAKKFVTEYTIDNAICDLTVTMYIKVLDSNESEISLKIPLNTKTVDIETSDNLSEDDTNIFVSKKTCNYKTQLLIGAILLILLGINSIVNLIKYIIKNRTPESIYDMELKKILNNYRSYIQKINNEINFEDYQVLIVDTFTDMLEIRDTIQQPILMMENDEKTKAYFIILDKANLLYLYNLNVSNIKKVKNNS